MQLVQANAGLKAELDAMRAQLATATLANTPPPRRNTAPSPKTPTPLSGPPKRERSQKPEPKKLQVAENPEDEFEGFEEGEEDFLETDQEVDEMDDGEGKVDKGKNETEKHAKKKEGKKEEGKKAKGKKQEGKKNAEDDELTEAAKNNRLRRVCERKPSGKCGVDDETHARWAKGGTERLALRDQLESCDWDKEGPLA